jgi:hypothetical protein
MHWDVVKYVPLVFCYVICLLTYGSLAYASSSCVLLEEALR